MQEKEVIFEEDPRYRQCTKEMWVTLAFFVLNVLIIGGVSFMIGYNKPADQVQIIAGFPDWFFYGAIVGWIVLCILPFIMIKFFFKDMSIEAEER